NPGEGIHKRSVAGGNGDRAMKENVGMTVQFRLLEFRFRLNRGRRAGEFLKALELVRCDTLGSEFHGSAFKYDPQLDMLQGFVRFDRRDPIALAWNQLYEAVFDEIGQGLPDWSLAHAKDVGEFFLLQKNSRP